MNLIRLSLLLPVVLAVSFLAASENPEAWLQADDDTSTRLVNEGDLEFLHETQDRRVSGHKMNIKTIVFGDGDTIIREYASNCAINDQQEIKRFKIRQKGV